jgi:O-antigen/teichoic acid export membrane protein
LFFYGEEAFVLIFGNEWSMAGRFAEILAPMFLMKFIASPLSYTLYIANRQLHDLGWQIALLLMTWAAFDLTGSLLSAVQVYSFGYSALYVIYLFISYRAARGVHS